MNVAWFLSFSTLNLLTMLFEKRSEIKDRRVKSLTCCKIYAEKLHGWCISKKKKQTSAPTPSPSVSLEGTESEGNISSGFHQTLLNLSELPRFASYNEKMIKVKEESVISVSVQVIRTF